MSINMAIMINGSITDCRLPWLLHLKHLQHLIPVMVNDLHRNLP